jgi:hypothetical protein
MQKLLPHYSEVVCMQLQKLTKERHNDGKNGGGQQEGGKYRRTALRNCTMVYTMKQTY